MITFLYIIQFQVPNGFKDLIPENNVDKNSFLHNDVIMPCTAVEFPSGKNIQTLLFCHFVFEMWIPLQAETEWSNLFHLYLYKYENVCLSAHVFLGHFETDWETLWHKHVYRSLECSKTIIFLKMLFFKRVIALFLYFFKISL